jgi:signal peptidase II
MPAAPRAPSGARRLGVLVAVALAVVAVDLGSKEWALGALSRERTGDVPEACTVSHTLTRARKAAIDVVPGHLSLEYTENCGGAFGLLGKSDEKLRFPFFVIVSIIAIGVIVSVYRRLEPEQRLLAWALPLVLGGALGNFYDRVVHRFVVDFIKMQLDERWVWPTFNVADAAISVGVAFMLIDMMWKRRERPAALSPAPGPAAVPAAGATAPDPSEAQRRPDGEA